MTSSTSSTPVTPEIRAAWDRAARRAAERGDVLDPLPDPIPASVPTCGPGLCAGLPEGPTLRDGVLRIPARWYDPDVLWGSSGTYREPVVPEEVSR
jgi:hypothetical protein